MEIINQPHRGSIGDRLQGILQRSDFRTFYIVVAYVKKSGVVRLKPSIEDFRSRGGQVKAVIGIDQNNTSYEGLQLLLELCDGMWVYHSENATQTFHPKVYAFEKEGKAIVFTGSSNLTAGGLYSNYEVDSFSEYDLTDPNQSALFQQFMDVFERYSKGSDCSKGLTTEFLDELLQEGYLSEEISDEQVSLPTVPARSGRRRLFGTETFRPPPVEGVLGGTTTRHVTGRQVRLPIQQPSGISVGRGELIWRKKNLPASDVQYPLRENTNPTGCLRLVQAGWKVNGEGIDQTKYFRYVVFRDLEWWVKRGPPKEELTKVLFDVSILGEHKGQFELEIRHKPSGEAGQRNYTTSLSWGPLGQVIESTDLRGRTLSLYAPEKGKEPFVLEIT